MKVKKILTSATALSALLLAACDAESVEDEANGDGEAETINIAGIFEQTGAVAAYGTSELHAVELAVEEINEAGGIDGAEINLTDYDTQSEETEAAQLATRAASEGAHILIGPATSGATMAAAPSATDAEVPLISPSATDDQVTVGSDGEVTPYVFRTSFQDSFQGVALANFANNDLEAETAVILGDNSSDYGVGLAEAFEGEFSGDIVSTEDFTAGDTDFNAVLTSLQNQDFDVLFVPGYYEEAGLIIRQAREMGIEQPILGPDGFGNQELLDLAGEGNVNDVYYSAHFSTEGGNDRVNEFISDFEEREGSAPDMFAALAYDTVYLVAEAVEQADEVTPEGIRNSLRELEDFEGVTGTFSFDDFHNPVKSAIVVELQNGEEVNFTEVHPE